MNNIKKLIAKSILTLTSLSLILPIGNMSLADEYDSVKSNISINYNEIKDDELTFDGSQYNEESEYLQYCLNRLGYTSSEGEALDQDGHFGNKSKSALSKFLKAQGLEYFNSNSKDILIQQAENTVTSDFESGFTSNSQLSPTAFVYSSVSNINESNDPFHSMSILKDFKYIITSIPNEMSYKSKRVMENIKANTNVFGYVNLGPDNPLSNKSDWRQADLEKVKSEIDSIANAGWYGVFIDQFGYDWNETRERQNTIVDYAHDKGLSVMANGWVPCDTLGAKFDSVSNPNEITTHLNSNDWYLIESFFSDGDSYRADSSYIEKYLEAKEYSKITGVNITGLSYKMESSSWDQSQSDITNSYILAHVLGFDGWWFGKTENNDQFLYGKEPNIDLGPVIKTLTFESDNKYVAETENYIIEYIANKTPTLNLISK